MDKYIKISQIGEEDNYYIDKVSSQPTKFYTKIDEKDLEKMQKTIKEYEIVQEILCSWWWKNSDE